MSAGMNRSTGYALGGMDHLRQSIADILFTPLGSRVARRTYGSLLPELIDQPDNPRTRVRLYSAIAGALIRWEPRLRLSRVQVLSGPTPGQAALQLDGVYVQSVGRAQVLSVRLPLQLRAAL
jgi:uncharacterized protein